jgi:DNA ligase-associated metallophosphoesterase
MAPRDMACIHELGGERVELRPEKALFWPRGGTLFVADFHLGKAAAFRSAGIPLPAGTTSENVERLAAAIAATRAERVVFLGDFLHAKASRQPATEARFAKWRAAHASLDLVLVRGNHDERAGDPPQAWRIACVEEGEPFGPFIGAHNPGALVGGYALAGHIHPAVRLSESGGDSLRLPCFWFARESGVLPAFGAFTGSALIHPRRGDHVFVVADGAVMRVA